VMKSKCCDLPDTPHARGMTARPAPLAEHDDDDK
jgi:hypothetical protein